MFPSYYDYNNHCRVCVVHITRYSRLLSDGDGELTEDVRIISYSLEVYIDC